jgi:hypothetical protein
MQRKVKPQPRAGIMAIRDPAGLNAAQIIGNAAAAGAGLLAAIGGLPTLVTLSIGPVLAVGVGTLLVIGGALGTVTVMLGVWWLERVALLIMGLGWFLLLPATFTALLSGRASSAVWLVIALIVTALTDVFKRYKRIGWAYLDPAR